MANPLVLVVFVAAVDAHDPSTAAMMRAARDALGSSATVTLQELERVPSDDEALDRARSAHADAVAEIIWATPQHLKASIHVHVEGAARWSDREIGFAVSDAPAERGRTLGFALASMLPDGASANARAPSPTSEPPAPSSPSSTALTPTSPAPIPRAFVSGDARGVARSAERPTYVETPQSWRGAVDAAAIGSVGIGGYGGGVGAALGARWRFAPVLALRVSGGARSGEVGPAQASSFIMIGALGLALHTPESFSRRFEVGARADFLVMRLTLDHLDADDPSTVHQSRWLTGADLLVEGTWLFSSSAGIFVATGIESALGSMDVYVAGARTAVVPAARVVSELGVLARF
jgi:hypothetical protein